VADKAAARCHFFFAHHPPLQIQHVGQNVPAKRNGPIRARAHSDETPPHSLARFLSLYLFVPPRPAYSASKRTLPQACTVPECFATSAGDASHAARCAAAALTAGWAHQRNTNETRARNVRKKERIPTITFNSWQFGLGGRASAEGAAWGRAQRKCADRKNPGRR
jgi:hypothetical protein